MDYRQTLRETMFRYDLKVKDLADKADVKETQLSAFRTGKRDLYASTLERIINAMPTDAQAYYYELLRRTAINPHGSIPKEPIAVGSHTEQGLQAPPPPKTRGFQQGCLVIS